MARRAPRLAVVASVLLIGVLTPILAAPAPASADHVTGTWRPTGALERFRYLEATVLDPAVGGCADKCGRVLVTGYSPTARLFDPVSGTWSDAGQSPTMSELHHTATLLRDGTVLVVGSGRTGAARYYPTDGSFRPTAPMKDDRIGSHYAVQLPDGRVLVGAGLTAQIYDPDDDEWSFTGPPIESRESTVATLLPDGKVLIAGGYCICRLLPDDKSSPTAELYDPATGRFSLTGSMSVGRKNHVTVLLGDGRVLIAGGHDNSQAPPYASAEIYDPRDGRFHPTGSMSRRRDLTSGVLLPSGKVLVVAGEPHELPSTAELFDPEATGPGGVKGVWTPAGSLSVNRYQFPAVALLPLGPRELCGDNCGKVLAAGGDLDRTTEVFGTAELYTPPPEVTGIAPGQGPVAGGTEVKLQGGGLFGATQLKFGDAPPVTPSVRSDGEITAVVPAGLAAGPVDVTVTTGEGSSHPVPFTYLSSPLISTVDPSKGPATGGTTVKIAGTNLATATAVQWGDQELTPVVNGDGTLTVSVPPHDPGPVAVSVQTTSAGRSLVVADAFTYLPVIRSLAPNTGETTGGKVVAIEGKGLAGTSEVRFGDTAVALSGSGTDTLLRVTTPPREQAGDVVVRVTAQGLSAVPLSPGSDIFRYTVPVPPVIEDPPTTVPSGGSGDEGLSEPPPDGGAGAGAGGGTGSGSPEPGADPAVTEPAASAPAPTPAPGASTNPGGTSQNPPAPEVPPAEAASEPAGPALSPAAPAPGPAPSSSSVSLASPTAPTPAPSQFAAPAPSADAGAVPGTPAVLATPIPSPAAGATSPTPPPNLPQAPAPTPSSAAGLGPTSPPLPPAASQALPPPPGTDPAPPLVPGGAVAPLSPAPGATPGAGAGPGSAGGGTGAAPATSLAPGTAFVPGSGTTSAPPVPGADATDGDHQAAPRHAMVARSNDDTAAALALAAGTGLLLLLMTGLLLPSRRTPGAEPAPCLAY